MLPSDIQIDIVKQGPRTLASTGSKWEPKLGYSRAVRIGSHIAVTGTVGINADGKYPEGLEAQARRALQIIRAAIEHLGGDLTNVLRTRIYVTDVSKWEEVAKAHGELFGVIRPATTIVEVAKLIDKDALVEIEADAIV
jgi:enamine deaminase RidA (YjgF/YER057c/UK114 family)